MEKFQATYKYFAVFLALFAFNDSLVTHGRQIKPLTQQHSSLNTHKIAIEDNPQPTLLPLKTSVNVPTPSSEKKVDPSMIPNFEVASFEDSGAAYTNGFRPTTPGSSPGVGHKKSAEDKDIKAMLVIQSPDVEVSVTEGSKNDFRPTDPNVTKQSPTGPSSSPGIGHPRQNKDGQLN